nr:MAG TPA_asm: hypothetical protein [Caudoviricetes sp.]
MSKKEALKPPFFSAVYTHFLGSYNPLILKY